MFAFLKFFKKPAVFLPLLAGGLFSITINGLNWDQAAQLCFYESASDTWSGREMPLMVALYEYAVLPALLFGAGGATDLDGQLLRQRPASGTQGGLLFFHGPHLGKWRDK
jgi:hypothetical protein